MLRMELEIGLITGKTAVRDLPAYSDEKSQRSENKKPPGLFPAL
jgi:Zn-dependent M32 family carboxypeptidase